jgi:hypothetical protein
VDEVGVELHEEAHEQMPEAGLIGLVIEGHVGESSGGEEGVDDVPMIVLSEVIPVMAPGVRIEREGEAKAQQRPDSEVEPEAGEVLAMETVGEAFQEEDQDIQTSENPIKNIESLLLAWGGKALGEAIVSGGDETKEKVEQVNGEEKRGNDHEITPLPMVETLESVVAFQENGPAFGEEFAHAFLLSA